MISRFRGEHHPYNPHSSLRQSPEMLFKQSFQSTPVASPTITEKQRQREEGTSKYIHALHYFEPNPSFPPSYKSANPNPTVRYPVYEVGRNALVEDVLPDYSPAVNKITLILRKVELMSPYEVSTSRQWRNLVMEINSTQLNFFTIEDIPHLHSVANHNRRKNRYEFTEFEQQLILDTISKNKEVYLTPKRLVRSYSLQMAKFGLPIDYKKKNYCLRIRLETEQLLLKFTTLNDLIDWANYLSIGINVSLDLSQRQLPKDKTVPRRRRHRRRTRDRSHSDSEIIPPTTAAAAAAAAAVDIRVGTSMNSNGRRSSVAGTTSSIINREINNHSKTQGFLNRLFHKPKPLVTGHPAPIRDDGTDIDQLTRNLVDFNLRCFELSQKLNSANSPTMQYDEEEQEEEEEDDEYLSTIHESPHRPRQSSSSNQEDDSDSDDESLLVRSSPSSLSDLKTWKPSYKPVTQKKTLKDCLRCLNLLTHNDNWIGKTVIRFDKGLYCNIDTRALRDKRLKEYIVGPHGFIAVN